jgi:hypothetical protein
MSSSGVCVFAFGFRLLFGIWPQVEQVFGFCFDMHPLFFVSFDPQPSSSECIVAQEHVMRASEVSQNASQWPILVLHGEDFIVMVAARYACIAPFNSFVFWLFFHVQRIVLGVGKEIL